jgi:hypothetical protein
MGHTPPTTASFFLRRSTLDFPATVLEGTGVTSTTDTSFVNAGLDDGVYYYSIFARDSYGNYSNAGTASTTIDTTAPSAPSSFSAVASGSSVHLTWSNPVDADFASSTIRRSTTDFPTSVTDGTAVTSTTMTSYTDPSLADGTYYYSIFATDLTGNRSVRATSRVTIDTYVAPPASPAPSSGGGGGGVGSSFTAPSAINSVLFDFSVSSRSNTTAAPTPSSPAVIAPLYVAPPTIKPVPVFVRALRQGDRGTDVKALQIFLNTHGFVVAKKGQGSPGSETTFFGAATANAVKKFQETYKDAILKPYNLKKGTGVLGLSTMSFIKDFGKKKESP